MSVIQPFMGIFNNLVVFDPKEAKNSPDHIVHDLAESWSWSDDKTKLTFKLRQGVKWHDGKPFTAADVKCTWDLILGRAATPLRANQRNGWYHNLRAVIPHGDYDVTFQLDQLEAGLKVGMSATAEVVVKQAEGVNVPTSAISADSVTVKRNGKEVRQRVVTGLAGNTSTIVLSGLRAGETVVLPAASTTGSSATNLLSKLGGRAGGGLGSGGIGGGAGIGGGGGAFFRGGG